MLGRPQKLFLCYLGAAYVRLWLLNSDYQEIIRDHIEVSTPMNSWKRVQEGVYLRQHGVDPYTGDRLHESPLFMWCYENMLEHIPQYVNIIFMLVDLLVAYVLFLVTQRHMLNIYKEQKANVDTVGAGLKKWLFKGRDFALPPYFTAVAYLFNPLTLINCVGLATSTFCNLFIALALLAVMNGNLLAAFFIALATTHSFYPLVLIVPMALKFTIEDKAPIKATIGVVSTLLFMALFSWVAYLITNNWNFLEHTYGFVLTVPDFQPNIGLFWYFFIEMFDHFRSLFIYSFQINATILYLIGLSIRFRHNALLLMVSLLSVIATFKSYPSAGDVGLILSLMPLWTYLFNYLQQGFLVGVSFLVSAALGPIVWHSWIYSRSANANFYFGVTLAFAVAQIFLLTDILFAFIKMEYGLKFGRLRRLKGAAYKLVLE